MGRLPSPSPWPLAGALQCLAMLPHGPPVRLPEAVLGADQRQQVGGRWWAVPLVTVADCDDWGIIFFHRLWKTKHNDPLCTCA